MLVRLALQEAALQEALEWIMTTYPFDALSHYLSDQPLHPCQHIQTYRRGHCLDLAAALSCELGGISTVVGQIKSGWSIPTHYAVLVSKGSGGYWLDPSIGICTPLAIGAEFYLGAKRNVITSIEPQRFELMIDNSRQIRIAHTPVDDLINHQKNLRHTRKDLTLRFGSEQVRYLWRQNQFQWDNRLLLPKDLSTRDRYCLATVFKFDVVELLETFLTTYSRLPEQFWRWEL